MSDLRWPFGKYKGEKVEAMTAGSKGLDLAGIVVVEGIAGTWFYHLAHEGKLATAICGKETMATGIPLSTWGYVGHLKERYCRPCMDIAELEAK